MSKQRGYLLRGCVAFLLTVSLLVGLNAALAYKKTPVDEPPPIDEALFEQAEQLNQYDIIAELDVESKTLKATQRVTYRNTENVQLDEIYFHLYPNAFRTEENAPFALAEMSLAYPNGFSEGGIDIHEVLLGGKQADYTLEGEQGTVLKLTLEHPLPVGAGVTFEFDYTVLIPNCYGRFGYGQQTISLMNCYPIAAVYDEDGWQLDEYSYVGDPFYSDVAGYSAKITVPGKYTLAVTGRVNSRVDDPAADIAVYEVEGPMMRDFAFIVSDRYQILQETVGNTLVYSYHTSKSAGEAALRAACDSLAAFNDMFGEYPYPTYSVCEADFYIGGMEYPSLVLIGSNLYGRSSRDWLEMVIAHETAHQWFYGIVGNNEIKYPWLDEALTEYAMVLYYGTNYDEVQEQSAYDRWVLSESERTLRENLPIYSPSYAFSDNASYSRVVYSRGAAMLSDLREQLGREGYLAVMKRYVADNRFKNAVPQSLFDAILETTGEDYTGFLMDYLTYTE